GDRAWFIAQGFDPGYVIEDMWWETFTVPSLDTQKKPLAFTFLPARHWSQSTLFDKNCSLWGSWLIAAGQDQIYFGGDTAYGPHFKAIATEFKPSIALLPVGPCEPKETMSHS